MGHGAGKVINAYYMYKLFVVGYNLCKLAQTTIIAAVRRCVVDSRIPKLLCKLEGFRL